MPCEIYKQLTDQISEAAHEIAWFSPQNTARTGVSESKQKQHRKRASDVYAKAIDERASHRDSCEECKQDRNPTKRTNQ
jgi:hypothetical protein